MVKKQQHPCPDEIDQLFCLTDMITDEEQLKEMMGKYKPDGYVPLPEMP